MVDSKENDKFDLGVKGLTVNFKTYVQNCPQLAGSCLIHNLG